MGSYRILEVKLHAFLDFKLYGSGQINSTSPLPHGIIFMDTTEEENHLPLPGNRTAATCPISSSGVQPDVHW